MAWTAPRTWTTGELVTAAMLNAHVRDDLLDADARMPWIINIDPRLGGDSNTNWPVFWAAGGGTAPYGNYIRSQGAQNDEIVFSNVALAAGTWKIIIAYLSGTDRGIFSIRFDGVEKGTLDGYNVAGTNANLSSVTGITVSSSGRVALSFKMATKNASSSSYYGYLASVELRRTA